MGARRVPLVVLSALLLASANEAAHEGQRHHQETPSQLPPDLMQRGLKTFVDGKMRLDPNAPPALHIKLPDTPELSPLSGTYQLHRGSTWNGRPIYYKGTEGLVFWTRDLYKPPQWVVASAYPLKRVTFTMTEAGLPPLGGTEAGWKLQGVSVSQADAKEVMALSHSDLSRIEGKYSCGAFSSVVIQRNEAGVITLVEDAEPDTVWEIIDAQEDPPMEKDGHFRSTYAVVTDKQIFSFFTVVTESKLHFFYTGQKTVSCTRQNPGDDGAEDKEATELARNILKNLFGVHFSKPVVERVTGCTNTDVEDRIQKTFNCKQDRDYRITISGNNFGTSGASVYLLKGADKEKVICANTVHDAELPTQVLTCDLPRLEAGQKLDVVVVAKGSDGETFESILYGAVRSTSMQKEKLRSLMLGDYMELGVGGLGKEFEQIFRRAFASRLQDDEMLKRLGVRHVRGVVLHGPPGTGKTLLARRIGELLDVSKVHTVSGPEILNKYVGQSESNLRKLFNEAIDEAKEDDGLHMIIFDEMDAIMKQRGGGDDSGARAVYDGVTTQLLTLMDGLEDKGNLLVLGLTNRLDSVDPALLRPGRFEVKIKMPLPDENGRHEIFEILTKQSRDAGMLSPKVDLRQLARDAPSFSGADIEGVIKSATSHALSENLDELLKEEQKKKDGADEEEADVPVDAPLSPVEITHEHFARALKEVEPTFGSRSLSDHLDRGVVHYSESFTELLLKFDRPVHLVKKGRRNKLLKVLIEGQPGSGLTTVAAYVARRSGFPYVHLLSMEDLVGKSEWDEVRRLQEVFENAYLIERSCIVLDKLELIADRSGRSGALVHTLQQLLTKTPVGKGKLLILVTTNSADALRHLGIETWDMQYEVPLLDRAGMEEVLTELKVFKTTAALKSVVQQLPLQLSIKRLYWLVDQCRVIAGISEDVHTPKDLESQTFPYMHGKTQYVVPPVPVEDEEKVVPGAFASKGVSAGWDPYEDDDEDDDDGDLSSTDAETAALAREGFVPGSLFLDVMRDAGLLSADGGLPSATGVLVL
eukprot:TRINITY_DN1493_c0_g1_i1.p1 TRINITY_DN1493_c0_g1~~TRINITY_DN1493_c0_g1_i1.p1  ORF type:complete len:1040 (+),score=432.41 TRINITY_DN1493_c0_g1_i1:64-3183(+)